MSGQDCDGALSQAPIRSLLTEAVGTVWAISDRARQIILKAFVPVTSRVRPLVEMAGTHHRSHIMENVTLTPKEQSRLQVLNSLAAEHMTLDQAARVDGSNFPPHPPHPGGLP